MPFVELERSHRSLAVATAGLYRDNFLPIPTKRSIKRIVDALGLSYVGHGQECVATRSERYSGYVVKVDAHGLTGLEARLIYHSMRIMTKLFSHNFPGTPAVFGKHPEGTGVGYCFSYNREILGKNPGSGGYTRLDGESSYPFKRVVQTIEVLNLPVEIDNFKDNFRLGSDGGVYYLDTVEFFRPDEKLIERLWQYMETNCYRESDIHSIKQSVVRVNSLIRQIWTSRQINYHH